MIKLKINLKIKDQKKKLERSKSNLKKSISNKNFLRNVKFDIDENDLNAYSETDINLYNKYLNHEGYIVSPFTEILEFTDSNKHVLECTYIVIYNYLLSLLNDGNITVNQILKKFPTLKISTQIHRLYYIINYG